MYIEKQQRLKQSVSTTSILAIWQSQFKKVIITGALLLKCVTVGVQGVKNNPKIRLVI